MRVYSQKNVKLNWKKLNKGPRNSNESRRKQKKMYIWEIQH